MKKTMITGVCSGNIMCVSISHQSRYMSIVDGTVIDRDSEDCYLAKAQWQLPNDTDTPETNQPPCTCYIRTIIALKK